MEKPSQNKVLKTTKTRLELSPDLTLQERLATLRDSARQQTHYPTTLLPTPAQRSRGITEGVSVPSEITPEFVDNLTVQEQQHFLDNIEVPAHKQGSLEKTKNHQTLEYYAQNDNEAGAAQPQDFDSSAVDKIRRLGLVESVSKGINRITPAGKEQYLQSEAKLELTRLFAESFGLHGLDQYKSTGYANVLRLLNAMMRKPDATSRELTENYEMEEGIISRIASIASRPENQMVITTGAGVIGDPRRYTLNERGEFFVSEGNKILSEMGESTQLRSRASESDQNKESIEKPASFRFPKVKNVQEILKILSHGQHSESSALDIQQSLEKHSALTGTQNTVKFLFEQSYVTRTMVTSGNIGRTYMYTLTERGVEFLYLLEQYEQLKNILSDLLAVETSHDVLSPMVNIIQILHNQKKQLSKKEIIELSSKYINESVIPHLEHTHPPAVISSVDPDSIRGSYRKLYALTDHARDVIVPLIEKCQTAEVTLIHDHMNSWKKADGSAVQFY